MGVNGQVTSGDVWGIISILFVVVAALLNFSGQEKAIDKVTVKESSEDSIAEDLASAEEVVEEITPPVEKPAPAKPIVSWRERLTKGLARSRNEVWGKLENIFNKETLDEDTLEEVEELLYSADIGPSTATEIIDELRKKSAEPDFNGSEFKQFLRTYLGGIMDGPQKKLDQELFNYNDAENAQGPKVIMVVGVNGAGKTTTIGKLATKLTNQGAKVVVGACDTFRAAAVDQLSVWCDRAGAQMIRAKEGANPSGVGYQALEEAINAKADYCILDTAGRLHTKGNLMDELSKSKRVLKKLDESAPHHTLLVIDAITGQNALRQAEEFHQTLELSGLIFTKCDGSSKAGSAVGIVQKLNVPIAYIGVGENVEDLNPFKVDEYLDSLLAVNA